MRVGFLVLILSAAAQAQWLVQPSPTSADLRGIAALGNGVAWASGSKGTVLRTTDNGSTWQSCAVPAGAQALDFRGVQAFDAVTAMVMSSGKGELSRLYKTTDACRSWKLVLQNADAAGFWDGFALKRPGKDGLLYGDPVGGKFVLWQTADRGDRWHRVQSPGMEALPGEGAFAASNSVATFKGHRGLVFVTGGARAARFFIQRAAGGGFEQVEVPLAAGSAGAGIFSIGFRAVVSHGVTGADEWVAVGGDYLKPAQRERTAAYSLNDGRTWAVAETPPGGYRSSVAYSAELKAWIAVGPNGTDVSTDDGRNWRAVRPGAGEADDADQHWNALSLPFVVGPHGRIGLLRAAAFEARP